MSVEIIHRYTCPITGTVADVSNDDGHPAGWFTLNGELYAPEAQGVIAQRVMRGIVDPAVLTSPNGNAPGDVV